MPVRAPFPTFFNFVLFTVIFLRFLQFLKAFFPIEVTFFPIVTLFNFLQPSKLPVPISVTVSGITTVCSFLLFLNAFAAMPVTRYFTLLIVTVFGIVTFFAFFSLADSFVSVTSTKLLQKQSHTSTSKYLQSLRVLTQESLILVTHTLTLLSGMLRQKTLLRDSSRTSLNTKEMKLVKHLLLQVLSCKIVLVFRNFGIDRINM